VREVFKVPKIGTIAGLHGHDGRITRIGDAQARLLRDNVVVHEGKLGSLRRFKDDVSEVKTGFECGIGLEGFNDVKVGDVIESSRWSASRELPRTTRHRADAPAPHPA
jgi:translation initiation factor IF-2